MSVGEYVLSQTDQTGSNVLSLTDQTGSNVWVGGWVGGPGWGGRKNPFFLTYDLCIDIL